MYYRKSLWSLQGLLPYQNVCFYIYLDERECLWFKEILGYAEK